MIRDKYDSTLNELTITHTQNELTNIQLNLLYGRTP